MNKPKNFRARKVRLGKVVGAAHFQAEDAHAAYRVAHDGIDPLSGDWVEITQLQDDGPERGEVIREAIETMKYPENMGNER